MMFYDYPDILKVINDHVWKAWFEKMQLLFIFLNKSFMQNCSFPVLGKNYFIEYINIMRD